MGSDYKYKELAGISYIEYRDDHTGWNDVALKLTNDQFEKINDYLINQDNEMKKFLKSIVEESKNDD